MARPASSASTRRVSVRSSFRIRLACSAVKGLIGRRETSSASRSLNRMLRILYRVSEGGAPCGNRFRRSTSSVYPDLTDTCAMRHLLVHASLFSAPIEPAPVAVPPDSRRGSRRHGRRTRYRAAPSSASYPAEREQGRAAFPAGVWRGAIQLGARLPPRLAG